MLQDVPAWCSSYSQLVKLAADRKGWRAHQPTRLKTNARATQATSKYRSPPVYNLRSRKPKAATIQTATSTRITPDVANDTNTTPPPFPIFTKVKANCKKGKKKNKVLPWSNKRRQAFALAY